MTDPLRIVELRAENVKRLKVVELRPDPAGHMVVISGRNGQGKSSLLDSIAMALGGKDQAPAKPVRAGEDVAEIVVDLGDIVVTRKFASDGGTRLVVANKDGAKFPSPQRMLDELVGRLSFDPLAFSRQKPKEQAETLRELLGLNFLEPRIERQRMYTERTVVNRDVAMCERRLADLPAMATDLPEFVSLTQASDDLLKAQEQNAGNARKRELVLEQVDCLRVLTAEVEDLRMRLEQLTHSKRQAEATIETLRASEAKLVDIDTKPLRQRLEDAEKINLAHNQNARRKEADDALRAAKQKADELTKGISKIDADRQQAIADAKMPVDGLTFNTDGDVLLNDLPLEQASAAEQLRVSVAIGLAMNPKLRVLLIRDASLLDSDSMKLVAEMAKSTNSQLWIERIEEDENTTVVIEDGEIKERTK